MSIPNELVQGIVDIKTAIENKSADTPVVIPDREYPDELCEALGAVKDAIENSQGGGSENYKEVITGTAAAPFGDYTISELVAELQAGNISMLASIDGTALGITNPVKGAIYSSPGTSIISMDGASFITEQGNANIASAFLALWTLNEQKLYIYTSGTTTNATLYMAALPMSVTIYHHPMPEE